MSGFLTAFAGALLGFTIAFVLFLFWEDAVIVYKDKYTKHGRVNYKGKFYELKPSNYRININGEIFIKGKRMSDVYMD